jgi:hypothetical protein
MKLFCNNVFTNLDTFFIILLKNVFDCDISFGTVEDSEILLETVFEHNTLLYAKKWAYTFLFIGESDRRLNLFMPNRISTINDYSCVLKGEINNNNVVNFPLFVLYSYWFNFIDKFVKLENHIPIIRVPPKNICVIVSNISDSEGRNYFCDELDKKIHVDYGGKYKNNIPLVKYDHSSPEFINFVSEYKFIIAMENSKNNHYITEKIMHGFAANTIPVYWGSDYICDYFNEERFILIKDFNQSNIDKVIEQILYLIANEDKYLEIINKPIYKNNKLPFTIDSISSDIKKLLKIESITEPIIESITEPIIESITEPKIESSNIHTKFITFGGPTQNFYNSVNRICNEAKNLNLFKEIIGFTDNDLKNDIDFWSKHSQFIENNSRGYGYYIWKPYLIKKELAKLKTNDILIYADCGCEINLNGKKRLLEYINLLSKSEYGLISFQLTHKEYSYTKKAIVDYFNLNSSIMDTCQILSGIIIIKKNNHSINIINKWYESSHYHLINDITNNEHQYFKENRHDQSILSVISKIYGSIILDDETYFDSWDKGFNYPFLAKRIKNNWN